MVDGGGDDRAALEYSLLEGPEVTADLALGEAWSFGRDERCTETLYLPTLSRIRASPRHAFTAGRADLGGRDEPWFSTLSGR